VSPGEGPEPRFERVRDFVGDPERSAEAAYALGRAALAARRLDVARQAISAFVKDSPQARFCALMGEIEDAAGDKGRSREWLARAIHAPRDPMWVSDGVASPRWLPVSPVTGEIVHCEWKVPFDMLPVPQSATEEAEEPAPAGAKALIAPEAPKPAQETTTPWQRPPDDPGIAEDER
jgi:HemY protein